MPPHDPSDRSPILVTGVPRSGTTWLARLLAAAPGTGLAGREPMNPRARQYGLGGTLTGWAELTDPTPRQTRALRSAYRGTNPFVLSRFGRRQWAAPLPWTRVIIKDPFALLSMPAVVAATGATPILVYRHPGAVLVSYRRMGWSADLDEVRPLVAAHRAENRAGGGAGAAGAGAGAGAPGDDVAAMAEFWAGLHEIALDHLPASAVVVSHEELGTGGEAAARTLFDLLGLRWSAEAVADVTGPDGAAPGAAGSGPDPVRDDGTGGPAAAPPAGDDGGKLHRFDRAPAAVARGWRARLEASEVERIEAATAEVHARLADRRLDLTR